MMRSLSTSALGQPSDTKPTLGAAGLAARLLEPALVGADAAVLMARGFYRPGAPGATRLAGARGPEPRPTPCVALASHKLTIATRPGNSRVALCVIAGRCAGSRP